MLPDILRARDLPSLEQEEESWYFEPFLWLDSDLIINEHCKKPGLGELYQACLELNQPIIGSDLLLFYGKNPLQLQRVLEEDGVEAPFFFKTVNGIPGGDNSRISGGVVLWNPEILPEVKAPTRKMGGKPGLPPAVRGIYSALAPFVREGSAPPLVPFFDPSNRTEEGAMDRILGQWFDQGHKVQFFSTIYNCRPCCLQNEEDVNKVVVVHWDSDPPYTQKPWEVTADGKATLPERLWWANFGNLVEAYPSVLKAFTEDPILKRWNAWRDFLQPLRAPTPEGDGDDGTD